MKTNERSTPRVESGKRTDSIARRRFRARPPVVIAALSALTGVATAACLIACSGAEGPSAEVLGATAQASLGEPVQAASTGSWWYYGQTAAQVSTLISSNDARLVSLRVASTSPLLFDVALVQNTGTFAKTWWWYYGQTEKQLSDLATANDARIVSLEPYVVNGTTLFAAIMVHNVGADASGWWWYYGKSAAQIATLLQTNNARLVDLRGYGGVYGAVMVPNTGANQSGSWWYYNITPAQVTSYLDANNAYLISLDPANASGTTFNVIMAPNPGIGWSWYYGQTAAQVASLTAGNKARVFDMKTYFVNGTRYFAVLLLNNTWNAAQQNEASCDSSLTSGWQTTAPAVGLGSASEIAAYDGRITALMKKYGVPGGAVAVMNNGKLVMARGYGMSDTGNSVIAHPDSLFRLASVSKQITSAAILTLVQKGKLSLSDKPFASGNGAYLGFTPSPSGTQTAALSSITVKDLLQHTGGFSRETGCTGCATQGDPMFESQSIASAQGQAGPSSCDQIIKYMQTKPLKWTPGTVSDYSNFGYCVLGAVVEKVTGTGYANWVTSNVLDAAGAGGIVQGQTLWPADREVVYYDYPGSSGGADVFESSQNAYTNPYGNWYLEAMAAHGAWVASPVDLLRLQGALDGRSQTALLTPSSIGSMLANPNVPSASITNNVLGTTAADPCVWYGFGWAVRYTSCPAAGTPPPAPSSTNTNWWHFGDLPGTVTEQVHAGNGWGWAAFFNSRPSDSGSFENELDSTLWAAFNAVPASGWLNANLFDQYGAYTGWMTSAAYQTYFNAQVAAGRYPSRVEGYDTTGTPLIRAAFAPYHATSTSAWTSNHLMDCPTYKSKSAALISQGYETASLQSFASSDGTRRYQATWVKW